MTSTVRIVTEDPMADLLDLLVAMPISPASELDKLPGEYVGSGPYKIAEQSDARLVLAAHDEYWGEAPEVPGDPLDRRGRFGKAGGGAC